MLVSHVSVSALRIVLVFGNQPTELCFTGIKTLVGEGSDKSVHGVDLRAMYLVVKDKGINILKGVFGYLWMLKSVVYRLSIVSRTLKDCMIKHIQSKFLWGFRRIIKIGHPCTCLEGIGILKQTPQSNLTTRFIK